MRNRLVKLVEQAPPDRMLTLTVKTGAYDSPAHAARRMSWAFPKLVAKMRRWADSGPTEYLAVWERTRAGWPHLHVLLRGPFIPHALVSKWWASLTQSPVVWFTHLGGARAGARYVTKYLTKDPDPFGQGRALRASRGFLAEPMRPQGKRYCALGVVKIYEGPAWNWLAEQLDRLQLVDVDDTGQCVSGPWSTDPAETSVEWLRWSLQQDAVRRRERPPPPRHPLFTGPMWLARAPEPDPEPERAPDPDRRTGPSDPTPAAAQARLPEPPAAR